MNERERYVAAWESRRADETAAMLHSSQFHQLHKCSVCNGLLPDVERWHVCKDWISVPVAPIKVVKP